MSKRKFCSHRGFNAVAPENTLPAFAAAVALGADEIEFDLWPTADGQLAVCHDPSVDRTTDGKGTICDMTWEQMKNLDAGKKFHSEYEGVRIPLFEEVLRQFAGKVVMNIHIKSIGASVLKNRIMEGRGQELMEIYTENKPLPMPLREPEPMVLKDLEDREIPAYDENTFQKILQLLDKYQCRDMVYITGEKDVLETALKMAPDIKRCCLEGHMNYSIVENAIRYQCSRVQFCKLFLTRSMIDKAHAKGMICNLFWSDDIEQAGGRW